MLPFIPMMLGGAGLGALLNKKDPLKGALMGAALGGVGGAAAPGLLGGATAGGVGSQAGMLAAQEAGAGVMGIGNMGWGGATTGIQGGLNAALGSGAGATTGGLLGNADKVIKPVGTAMQAAQMFTPPTEEPIRAPMPQIPQGGSQVLSQIATQPQQQQAQNQQMDMQRKQQRQARIRNIGYFG